MKRHEATAMAVILLTDAESAEYPVEQVVGVNRADQFA